MEVESDSKVQIKKTKGNSSPPYLAPFQYRDEGIRVDQASQGSVAMTFVGSYDQLTISHVRSLSQLLSRMHNWRTPCRHLPLRLLLSLLQRTQQGYPIRQRSPSGKYPLSNPSEVFCSGSKLARSNSIPPTGF